MIPLYEIAHIPESTTHFESLYRQYAVPIYDHILTVVKDEHLAADICQDVFLLLWEKLDNGAEMRSASSWLYVISHGKALQAMQQQDQETVYSVPDFTFADHLADEGANEENFYFRISAIRAAATELPQRQRQVFHLHEFEGKSIESIALLMGLSVVSVSGYLKQAVRWIRRYIFVKHGIQTAGLLLFTMLNSLLYEGLEQLL